MDVLRVSSQATTNANDVNANNNNNNANNANNNNNNNNNNANNVNGPVPPIPPIFPGHPMMFQHFQQLFQRQNNNQQNNRNENVNNGPNVAPQAGAAGSSAATTNPFAQVPQIAIPSTVFPFLQSPPFPMPQLPTEALLQGLSDQELRLMEGAERQNIEARIKCLLDAKTLINAATLRLQQYNNVLINSRNSVSISTQTEPFYSEPSTSSASRDNASPNVNYSFDTTTVSDDGDQNDKELIRQRRLQRFSQAGDSNAESSSSAMPDNSAQNEN